MKRRVAIVVAAGAGAVACAHAAAHLPPPLAEDRVASRGESLRWTFDEPARPAGSGFAPAHPTATLAELLGHWRVEPIASATSAPNAFCQRGSYGNDEPRVLATGVVFGALEERVACLVDATTSCALLATARGADRYVVARADARSGRLTIAIARGDALDVLAQSDALVTPGAWHRLALRIEHDPPRAVATWDDAPSIAAPLPSSDVTLGRVGLAGGGDGATCVDDWAVSEVSSRALRP